MASGASPAPATAVSVGFVVSPGASTTRTRCQALRACGSKPGQSSETESHSRWGALSRQLSGSQASHSYETEEEAPFYDDDEDLGSSDDEADIPFGIAVPAPRCAGAPCLGAQGALPAQTAAHAHPITTGAPAPRRGRCQPARVARNRDARLGARLPSSAHAG